MGVSAVCLGCFSGPRRPHIFLRVSCYICSAGRRALDAIKRQEAQYGHLPFAWATSLYAKTKDLVLVQRWLGHTDIKMTLRYAKLLPGDLQDARDLLEAA